MDLKSEVRSACGRQKGFAGFVRPVFVILIAGVFVDVPVVDAAAEPVAVAYGIGLIEGLGQRPA